MSNKPASSHGQSFLLWLSRLSNLDECGGAACGATGRCRGSAVIVVIALLCALLLTAAFAAPGDIAFEKQETQQAEGIPSAVFPHWFHRIRYRCFVCHPDIFPMEQTNEGQNMQAIEAGKSCGTCHNGEIAWAPSFETCARCHVPPPE